MTCIRCGGDYMIEKHHIKHRVNGGDDAMLWCWLDNMNHDDTAYVLCKEPCYVPPDKTITFVPYNVLKAITGLYNADNLTIVGGTHFSNYGKMHRNLLITLRILVVCVLAKILRKKVYFDSIGIVCGNWWLWVMLFITSRFTDKITVRDKISQVIFNSMGIKADLVDDLAIGLLKKLVYKSKNTDILGVNVSPLYKIYFDYPQADIDIINVISDIINNSVKYNNIKLIVFREGDTNYTRMLQNKITKRTELVPYNPDPVYALNEIAKCGHLLAMKYHACYYAKMVGVPYTNLSTHPKNERL